MKLSKSLGVFCARYPAIFSLRRHTHRHHRRRCHHRAPQDLPRLPENSRQLPATSLSTIPSGFPANTRPTARSIDLAGLKFSADGKTLKWRRDLLDGFTIHVEVPAGVTEVAAELDFLSPATFEGGFSAGSSATDKLAVISWNQVLLYPKGYKSDDINYTAVTETSRRMEVRHAAARSPARAETKSISRTASLTTLVDSPVITGEFLKVVPLAQDPLTEMDIAADSAAALDAPRKSGITTRASSIRRRSFSARITTATITFSTRSAITSRTSASSITNPTTAASRNAPWSTKPRANCPPSLLPHEYVHSWNGKFRRPADLATPDYQQPMQDDLLWVYEGLTNYLGFVLTARSGLLTADQDRDDLAITAAAARSPSRPPWRNLQDTADAAPQLYFSPQAWYSWRRGTDFYNEDTLNWLWVDVIIRQQTKGKKSIDDFCHLFHGAPSTGPALKTYTFDDVVNALNQVVAYDWRGFWTERLTNHGPGAPLGGIEGSGWKVVYDENPSEMMSSAGGMYHFVPAGYSLGLDLRDDGGITDTIEGEARRQGRHRPRDESRRRQRPPILPRILRDAIKAAKKATDSDRVAGRKHRLLQNLQTRLPRRRNVSAPGPRRIQSRTC